MKIRTRVVLVTLALTIPSAVAASVLYGNTRRESEVAAIAAAVRMGVPADFAGECEPGRATRLESLEIPTTARGGPRSRVAIRRFELWALPPTLDGRGLGPSVDPAMIELVAAGSLEASRVVDEPDGQRIEVLVAAPPRLGGCAYVLARDAAATTDTRALPMPWLALPIFSLVVVLVGLAPVVARLRRLAATARALPDGSGAVDVPITGDDEIADCARAFVDAGVQLRARAELIAVRERTLRQYVDDTSHDIALPLSVLRGHLARLFDAPQRDEGEYRATVRAAIDEAHYMGALLHDLATFAALERGLDPRDHARVDLGAIVERAASRHRMLAELRRVTVECAVPDRPVVVDGDPTCIEQAVSNLVLNAVRHHPGDGNVAVVLDRDHDRFALRVIDDGTGVPAGILESVRAGAFGENRPRGSTGRGLGLRIVDRVASLHGWEFALRGRSPSGTHAELRGAIAT